MARNNPFEEALAGGFPGAPVPGGDMPADEGEMPMPAKGKGGKKGGKKGGFAQALKNAKKKSKKKGK